MNLKYNQDGCLLYDIYELSLQEVEEEFVKGKSQRRKEIFDNYQEHISEIKDTDCCLNHWINGSFVTLKENPGDIDTFTEFDGVKIKLNGIEDSVDKIIFDAPLRTEGYCHSFAVYKFPENMKKDYDDYLNYKSKFLYILFPTHKDSNHLKGFIKLKGGN